MFTDCFKGKEENETRKKLQCWGQCPYSACWNTPISPPSRVALKERNGVVPEGDSPVKRPGRKAARVLGSEGEEEDEALTPPKDQVGPCQPVHFTQRKHLPVNLWN